MTEQPLIRLGEAMHRTPNTSEAEARDHVLDLARGWQAGTIGLDSIRQQCSGWDRFQAVRFSGDSPEDVALLVRLTDALETDYQLRLTYGTTEGYATQVIETHTENAAGTVGHATILLTRKEMERTGYRRLVNYRGETVWVTALHKVDGAWVYPPINLPPGEERRDAEARLMAEYTASRKKQRRHDHTRREDDE